MLSRVEKERVIDSRLKIQSVSRALREVNPSGIPGFDGIEECLEDADKNLGLALRAAKPESRGE
jgi:hypothetical protein